MSVTRIMEVPPSRISTVTAVAFASMAFSKSSFTTEAGRSITSPAAILLMVFWSRIVIIAIGFSLQVQKSFQQMDFHKAFLWIDFHNALMGGGNQKLFVIDGIHNVDVIGARLQYVPHGS